MVVDLVFVEGFFRLVSVICKKYTNTNGKGSKYTNTINISIIRSCGGGGGVQGVRSPVEEGVRGVEEGVEGITHL